MTGMHHVVHQLFMPLFCISRMKRTYGKVLGIGWSAMAAH